MPIGLSLSSRVPPVERAAAPDVSRDELTRGTRDIRRLDHAPKEAAAAKAPLATGCLGAPAAAEQSCEAHRPDHFEAVEAAIARNTHKLKLDQGSPSARCSARCLSGAQRG